MSSTRRISFGAGAACTLDVQSASASPGTDPELTVSTYAISGLERGKLSVLVTRSYVPAIVKVELAEQATGLSSTDLEQIRTAAEEIFRAQSQ